VLCTPPSTSKHLHHIACRLHFPAYTSCWDVAEMYWIYTGRTIELCVRDPSHVLEAAPQPSLEGIPTTPLSANKELHPYLPEQSSDRSQEREKKKARIRAKLPVNRNSTRRPPRSPLSLHEPSRNRAAAVFGSRLRSRFDSLGRKNSTISQNHR
jgi:hypothetical protein